MLQVIAFICGLIVIILMIMALASTDWLMSVGWRQGLFIHCIEDNSPMPLPFNVQDPPDCYQARDVGKLYGFVPFFFLSFLQHDLIKQHDSVRLHFNIYFAFIGICYIFNQSVYVQSSSLAKGPRL
jgi:hypothetical protein